MKKKTSPDRQVQRTRQFLLNALVDLIVEKGYEKVTVQDILTVPMLGEQPFIHIFRIRKICF